MDVITVDNVGKAYRQYASRWARLAEWVLPGSKPRHQLSWVLEGVSFSVRSSEAVGIVGINGAGKSTLLKLITGTTAPTEGSIKMEGRVAALLELGMGFHPDFTGRQNVFMAGQLLGFTMEELQQMMPAIEAFAEIGDYIDQPVRTYSSGMSMRLAFSVATARRPDVLIIDEALSVGDAYFQHKSFDRIRDFKAQGTTLLIVSHDRNAIQSICDRVVLLDGGKLIKQGNPEEVMDFYNAFLADREHQRIRQEKLSSGVVQTISGTGEVTIQELTLLNSRGEKSEAVEVGEAVKLRVKVKANQAIPRLVMGFMIKDRFGQPIYGINTHRLNLPIEDLEVDEEIEYNVEFHANLGKGHYSIAFALSRSDSHLDKNYEWRDHGLVFHVVNVKHEDFVGSTWLDARLTSQRSLSKQEV